MRNVITLIVIFGSIILSCTSPSDIKTINTIDDLHGSRIGVLTNTTYDKYINDHFPTAKIIPMGTQASLAHALSSGQCDAILTMQSNCKSLIDCDHQFTIIDSVLLRDSIAIGFRPEDQVLCNLFNDFLTKIGNDSCFEIFEQSNICEDSEPLKIGMNGVLSSLTYMGNEQLEGFEPTMMRRFGAYIGRNVQLSTVAFNSIVPYLKSKKVDAIACSFTITPERAKIVQFSHPYFYDNVVCVTRKQTSTATKIDNSNFIHDSIYNNLIVENRYKMLVDGLWTTIIISFFSIILGSIIGGLICFLSCCKHRVWHYVERGYVNIIQGIPILVLLMIMFYIIFANGLFTGIIVAIFTFSINFGASVCNSLCSSIRSIDKGQREAGLALGFGKIATFLYIIFPQALYRVLPIYKSTAIILVKNTSIVGYIAILDLTKAADIIRSRSFDEFSALILISIIYFIVAWLFGFVLDKLSKRLFTRK